jgi:uncharacterized protein (DUF1800 family)
MAGVALVEHTNSSANQYAGWSLHRPYMDWSHAACQVVETRLVTTDSALIAHLLRRTSFGPLPGQVEALVPGGLSAAIEAVLAAQPPALPPAPSLHKSTPLALPEWWLARMADPAAGLQEKLAWFWHGHFTSSRKKVTDAGLMYLQNQLLRQSAVGNFRALAQQITIDPAMLWYLDGRTSTASAPNENYAREFMELFVLGLDQYSQDDVHQGAIALSGWRIDETNGTSRFVTRFGPTGPVPYLGQQVGSAQDVVNAACGHPACAPFVVAKVFAYLAGIPPSAEQQSRLAALFVAAELELQPLVGAILRDPAFLNMRLNRPRYPVEWVTAAMAAVGLSDPALAYRLCVPMGQVPFFPPNVAGWPADLSWLAPSDALVRAALAVRAPGVTDVAVATDPVAAALQRCSIYEVSAETQAVLEQAAGAVREPLARAAVVLGLVISSPDFALA